MEGALLGIGNPLLDLVVEVDDKFLRRHGLPADGAMMAGPEQVGLFAELEASQSVRRVVGGSAQNMLRVAQWLFPQKFSCVCLGCVGRDERGRVLAEKTESDGVRIAYMEHSTKATGVCAVLVSGSRGERRFLVADLNASLCYHESHLVDETRWSSLVEPARCIYATAFFVTSCPPALMLLAKHCQTHRKPFCFNVSAPYLCERWPDHFRTVFPFVDILFGNEAEMTALGKVFNLVKNEEDVDAKKLALGLSCLAKEKLGTKRIVVLTRGADDVIVCDGQSVWLHSIMKVARIVDTNAAGDAFVGGFLSQMVLGKDLTRCVQCGLYAASVIIQEVGCTLPETPDAAWQSKSDKLTRQRQSCMPVWLSVE